MGKSILADLAGLEHRYLPTATIFSTISVLQFPIEVKVKFRMISFWSRLIESESKLSSILYKLMLSLYA